MKHLTFIFDLDDTLVYNQYLHYRSEVRWLVYAVERFYPKNKELNKIIQTISHQLITAEFQAKSPIEYLEKFPQKDTQPILEILERLAKIDVGSVEIAKDRGMNAFSSTRYPTSLVKTFLFYSESLKLAFTEEDCQEVYKIGKLAFDLEPSLIEGAKEVLDFLKKKKQEMVLFTRGDEKIQMRKLEINNLYGYFEEIHIVHHKDASTFMNIVGKRNKEYVYMVGNSFKSDILPALDSDVHAIYIPKQTWRYEDDIKISAHHRKFMTQIDSISKIIEMFRIL